MSRKRFTAEQIKRDFVGDGDKALPGAYSDDFAMQFRRKSPPDSDASRHGDPMDFATPGRSVATLDISFFS